MRFLKTLHPDLALPLPHINTAHKPDHFSFFRRLLSQIFHLGVEVREALHELRGTGGAFQRLRDEALHREGAWAFDFQPGDAGQDDEFPGDVEAVEVVARVGLGVAEILGFGNLGAPGPALAVQGREGVEEEAHGAGEDTLDFVDLVAGGDEVLEGGEDGEAGADGGFVVDEAAARVVRWGGFEDFLP